MNLRRLTGLALGAILGFGTIALAQDAKQDMKNAGTETKEAAKDTGHAVKTTTKKAYHKTKRGTKKAAHKVHDAVDPN